MSADTLTLRSAQLVAEIAAHGAELRSLCDASGAQWLWQGDPAWWTGRSPLLFPVVGKSPDDRVLIAGRPYPMPSHGLARISRFAIEAADDAQASLRLRADETTRRHYPFAFDLLVTYRLQDDRLHVEAKVGNNGETRMPFSFGFHPAFNWPLPGAAGQTHVVELANGAEPTVSPVVPGGLLGADSGRSVFQNGRFVPKPESFARDALVFREGAGDRQAFRAANGAAVEMETRDLPQFALWTKPGGAPFLCLEPWHGTAVPDGDAGHLEERPGIMMLEPGATRVFAMTLRIVPAPSSGR